MAGEKSSPAEKRKPALAGWVAAWISDAAQSARWHLCMLEARRKYAHRHEEWRRQGRPIPLVAVIESDEVDIPEACEVVAHAAASSPLRVAEWKLMAVWHELSYRRDTQVQSLLRLLSDESVAVIQASGLVVPEWGVSESGREEALAIEEVRRFMQRAAKGGEQAKRRVYRVFSTINESGISVAAGNSSAGDPWARINDGLQFGSAPAGTAQ